MNKLELRKLQLVELEILKEFIKVCEKLNLKYYLDSGTLLGCIRHEGFIPWDDDIDVVMPREDYEMFLKKGQAFLDKKYFIQNYKTDPEFVANFAKIRNSETTFIETTSKIRKINHGVYIDIFPLDNSSKSVIKRKYALFLNKIYNLKVRRFYYDISLKGKILNGISNIISLGEPLKSIQEKKEKLAVKNNNKETKYVQCYFYSTTNVIFNKEIFGNGIKKKFEDIYVNVPEKYDEYLKIMYGDYMKLPPKEKQIAHHYNEKIDLENSYKKYVK